MRKVQISSINQLCKHWSHNVFLKKVNQFYLSRKSYRDNQNSEILLSLNVIALSNSYIYIKWLQFFFFFFFFQDCFYIILLIIMFIKMFDIQYWKSNNICNAWKIEIDLPDAIFKYP